MLAVFGAHTLGNFVTLADRFLLLPVMLYVWGPAITGVWLTIRSLPAVLSVGELGFASATGNRMTDQLAENQFMPAARLFWATSRLINCISLGCIAFTLLATLCLPLARLFQCEGLSAWEFNLAVFLMAIYTISVFQTQLYYAGYRSIHLQATAAFGIHAVRVVELLLVVAALFFGSSVLAVATGYVVARLIGAFILRQYLLRKAPWLAQHRATDWSEVRPLVKPALGFASLPLAQTFQLQGTTLAVAAATNPEMVAAFTAMRTLARFPIQFCATLGRTAWPELSQALAQRQYAVAVKLQQRMMWLSLAMALASIVGLLLLGQYVYAIWTSSKLEFSSLTFALLSITAGLTAYSTNAMTLLNANSSHGRASVVWILLAGLSVVVTVAVPKHLGIVGISAVLLLCDIAVLAYVMIAARRQMNDLTREQETA
jgi:O-antigen/teichoic acid export membrane protein